MASSAQPTYPVGVIAKLLMLTERRVQQLAAEGSIPKAQHGRYERERARHRLAPCRHLPRSSTSQSMRRWPLSRLARGNRRAGRRSPPPHPLAASAAWRATRGVSDTTTGCGSVDWHPLCGLRFSTQLGRRSFRSTSQNRALRTCSWRPLRSHGHYSEKQRLHFDAVIYPNDPVASAVAERLEKGLTGPSLDPNRNGKKW
jgi:hypothetical protein